MSKHIEHKADFAIIVSKYHTMIFRTVIGFVHVQEDAEDLTQEVFVSVYQNISKFRGDSEISTWLYRIAVNTSLNFVSQKQRKSFLQFGDLLKSFFTKASDEKDPQQKLEADEEKAAVRNAIDSLPDKQRTALILTRFNDLPQKEVAQVMGISQRAVEQLLLRAKTNLRKILNPPIRKK